MNVRDEVFIAAAPQRVYELASDTQRWPQILPHYRYVRVRSDDGTRKTVEMAAKRPFSALGMMLPVRWRAEQIDDPQKPEIFFRHIGGWTNGMRVFWRFEAAPGGTRVVIDHDLESPIAWFIAEWFIHPIAERTLAHMKRAAETP